MNNPRNNKNGIDNNLNNGSNTVIGMNTNKGTEEFEEVESMDEKDANRADKTLLNVSKKRRKPLNLLSNIRGKGEGLNVDLIKSLLNLQSGTKSTNDHKNNRVKVS